MSAGRRRGVSAYCTGVVGRSSARAGASRVALPLDVNPSIHLSDRLPNPADGTLKMTAQPRLPSGRYPPSPIPACHYPTPILQGSRRKRDDAGCPGSDGASPYPIASPCLRLILPTASAALRQPPRAADPPTRFRPDPFPLPSYINGFIRPVAFHQTVLHVD